MLILKNPKIAVPVVLFAGLIWSFGPLVVRYMNDPQLIPWQYIFGRGSTIFNKIKIPAALMSGTLFASGLLQVTNIASYKLPDASINFCLLILGASVGCKFAEKTFREIANNSLHSMVATIILVLLGLIAAYVASFFVDTNILTLILSFSPGGIYEVAVIAIAFDLDPDFVAFHHIIRLLFILFTVPIILKISSKFKKLN